MFNNGAIGGAEKRFSSLFRYLSSRYPESFCFITNNHLLNHINRVYPDFQLNKILLVDELNVDTAGNHQTSETTPAKYKDMIPDPVEVDKNASWMRKVYWFGKNKIKQRNLFRKIDSFRKSNSIQVFIGVFSGILPLVFYIKEQPRKAAVIFSDMDSWFSDVHSDMNKLWYRKYYSFNYALEHSDWVDFLSPYIIDGVKKRNVVLNEERISVTACSAADYSKCTAGAKEPMEIAFCARLEPDKNPILYLQAAKEILKSYPHLRFYLLGEGSLVNEINDFIDSNSMRANVNFMFHKNPPEIFSRTSIFVSLQTGTNYPSLSVIEAMACGNAIVASDRGDTGLLVNNSNGLLVELTVDSVVNALKDLIANPQKVKTLGMAGREFVLSNHTIEKESEYYLELIRKTHRLVFGGANQ